MGDKLEGSSKGTLISSLDFGDPLYLHASDTGSLTIVSIKLKGTENYNVWANAMELALNVKNKYCFVDKSCIRSDVDPVLAKQWDRCNSVVLSWILNSISEDLFVGQIFSKVASTVWDELKETYSKIDGSVIFKLHQQICYFKQNGMPVSDYYHQLTCLWRQFDSLSDLPDCVCDASVTVTKFNQNIRLMQFLMGLDDSYQSLRSSILTKDPLPSVKGAFAQISGEESHRGISSSNSNHPAVFASKFVSNKRPVLKCTNCNKTGHLVEKCYELIGYPANYKGKVKGQSNATVCDNSSSVSGSFQLTADQYSKLMGLIKESSSTEPSCTNMAGPSSHEGAADW